MSILDEANKRLTIGCVGGVHPPHNLLRSPMIHHSEIINPFKEEIVSFNDVKGEVPSTINEEDFFSTRTPEVLVNEFRKQRGGKPKFSKRHKKISKNTRKKNRGGKR